jgi:hypothetical protein
MPDWKYVKSNVLVPEGAINAVDGKSDRAISLRCPHCMHMGSFSHLGVGISFPKRAQNDLGNSINSTVYVSIRRCPNPTCGGIVFAVIDENIGSKLYPPETIDFVGSNLPANLLETLSEAIDCHSIGAYRAASIMVRRLLEEICDQNGAKGRDLHSRLQEIRTKVTLPVELFEAMMELKILGNDAAHIKAKEYLSIGKDEVSDSIELAKEILKALYQLQSLVDRLKARKITVTG